MVMTHKSVKEQKKIPIHVKADNPARKFMSKADALKDNEKLKADREAVKKLEDELKEKRKAQNEKATEGNTGRGAVKSVTDQFEESDQTPEKSEEQVANENKSIEIDKLKSEQSLLKGPGSKAKKEKIQNKIDELESQ
jgi:hypothetical protein